MTTHSNFKALDWSEYRGYRYEADANGRVCIFDGFTRYLTAVDTVEQADAYVDSIEGLMTWIIQDWAGNRIGSESFQTFEDAWDYILGDLTDRLGLTEEDYQEFFAVEGSPGMRESRYLDPRDPRAVRS